MRYTVKSLLIRLCWSMLNLIVMKVNVIRGAMSLLRRLSVMPITPNFASDLSIKYCGEKIFRCIRENVFLKIL